MCVCVCVCVYHIFFIHSLVDGYLHWIHGLIFVTSAADVHVFPLCVEYISSNIIFPGVVQQHHIVVLFLVFWGIPKLLSIVVALIYVLTSNVLKFLFLLSLLTFVDNHSDLGRDGISM
jgi:hypothetical protein